MIHQIYFFSDIDDTLIQTKRKTDFNQNVLIASYDRSGNPGSYIYEGTKILLDAIIKSGIQFVPTTARNLDAYKRTLFYKNDKIKNVILNFGALIFIDGAIDKNWKESIDSQYTKIEPLSSVEKKLNTTLKKISLSLQVKIIDRYYISIYNKENLDNKQVLSKILETLEMFIIQNSDFYIYENGNSFALLPHFVNKKFAVDYLIDKYRPILTLGAGDNISDLDFMKSTHFKVVPRDINIKNNHNKNSLLDYIFENSTS